VAVETIVLLDVEGIGTRRLAATPCDLAALALGFLFGEGLILGIEDVLAIHDEPAGLYAHRVSIRLRRRTPVLRDPAAFGTVGMRDRQTVEELLAGPEMTTTLRLSGAELLGLHGRMVERQHIFRSTGGAHAAIVFGPGCEEAGFAEDVGRANAVDKAIGQCILAGRSTVGCGLVVSGRLSFDLVAKAARAGLELVSGVSAPFHLAVAFAEARGITLIGFARESRITIFAHPSRITAADPAS
jgi:FdhD protein